MADTPPLTETPPVSADRIIAANELAWQYWQVQARTGSAARWLNNRGLDPRAVQQAGWKLGTTSSQWHDTERLLQRHGVPKSVGLAAGLIRRDASGRTRDGFRDRIAVPVRSILDGRIAGFTARTTSTDPRAPKYLNSPANQAYAKSKLLLGAWEARQRASRSSLDALILVEGPFDAIHVSSQGPWAGIAPCGTALTAAQGEWLTALAQGLDLPLVLAYDGDDAGRAAEDRAWDLLGPAIGHRLRLAEVPIGRDPAEMDRSELSDVLCPAVGR